MGKVYLIVEGIEDVEKAIELGASTYLVKANYTLEEVVEKINKNIFTDLEGDRFVIMFLMIYEQENHQFFLEKSMEVFLTDLHHQTRH